MIISDLNYLEDVAEAASVVGGDCSVSVNTDENGKVTTVKSPGCSAPNVTSNISVTPEGTTDIFISSTSPAIEVTVN